MRIGIAGPLATADMAHLLEEDISALPGEMKGATLLVSLIEALLREGHEVVAFTTEPALTPARHTKVIARGRNFAVHYVPRRRYAIRPDRGSRGRMLDLFALERHALTDAMKAARPDIIHAHWTYEFAAAALDSGIPSLVTCHDSPWAILKIQRDLYRLGRYWMARSVLRRARHLTVVSPYLIDELRSLARAPLHVVPNPLPDGVFSSGGIRSARDYNQHPPQIAMLLNGWSARKNPEAGLRAMRLIRAIHPDATMHLYGPGYGQGEQAQRWANEQQLADGLVFHGWTPYTQTMRELAGMDLLLHPAIEESFGMTIAEAMAQGLPVVAGERSGAVPWVLGGHGCGGELVDVRSPEAIAQAVLSILSDPALYARYSAQGHERAIHNFSASSVARAYLEHYRRVLKEHSSEPSNTSMERAA